MRVERVEYRPAQLTGEGLRDFFAEVLAELDARPRAMCVRVVPPEGSSATIDFAGGNPVFCVSGRRPVAADYRRRWIPEHAVPLALPSRGLRLDFVPTAGNRLRVRD